MLYDMTIIKERQTIRTVEISLVYNNHKSNLSDFL